MADFHIDHDVAIEVARELELRSHTAFTARALGMAGARDSEHLLVAAQKHRILVTHNWADFKLLHFAWLQWSQAWNITATHTGILVVDHYAADTLAQEIHAFVNALQMSRQKLTNTLYRWRQNHGWKRY